MGKHTDFDGDGLADPDWAPPTDWSPCEDRPDPASWDDPNIADPLATVEHAFDYCAGK